MTGTAWAAVQPERIGRYRILERIGKGAMGVVYSARDEAMDRVVALKVMMTDLEGDPETRVRFYREAQAAGRLLHPNIITIFDMGEDEGRIYIVMELLRGQILGEFLKEEAPVPLEQTLSMMIQVCEGLGAAHAHGIFHRDVKPGNLFVLQDGTIKILDFGVARLSTSTMTAAGFIIGTPDYMSPEQARGGEIDQRSDVFSAGAVFYFMLSGRKPFGAADLPGVLRKVQLEDPPALPDCEVPAALFRIVAKSLAKVPALRYQNMAAFAADLAKFRRYYEGETRQIASAARDRYAAIEGLVKEREELASWLGLSRTDGEPPAARRLREEHAAFVDEGRDALLLVPFSRCHMTEIAAALDAEFPPLSLAVERLREERDAVEAAERALAAGNPQEALAGLGRTTGDSPRSGAVCARAQQALAEREADADRTVVVPRPGPTDAPCEWADGDETVVVRPPAAERDTPAVRLWNRLREVLGRGSR